MSIVTAAESREAREYAWCVGLLNGLDRDIIPLGPDHFLKVERLLDVIGPFARTAELRQALAAVITTSPEQQDYFGKKFDTYLRDAEFIPGEHGPDDAGTIRRVSSTTSVTPRVAEFPRELVVVLVLLFGVFIASLSVRPPAPKKIDAPSTTETNTAAAPTTSVTERAPRQVVAAAQLPPPPPVEDPQSIYANHTTAFRWVATLLWILATTGIVSFRFWRRRAVAERQTQTIPPFALEVSTPRIPDVPYTSDELRLTARAAHRRQRANVLAFSAEGTIKATIAALGLPTPVFNRGSRPPDYVFLIERAALADHQMYLFTHLAEQLSDTGAYITWYDYHRDPRVCVDRATGASYRLGELRQRHPEARLLIFGTGDGFLSPVTGELADWCELLLSWQDRALLSSVPPVQWSVREVRLAETLLILPSTLEGLRTAVEHFDAGTEPSLREQVESSKVPKVPRDDDFTTPEQIHEYLGNLNAFRWVASCAVYSELRWNLTLYLAFLRVLQPLALTEDLVLRVARLPWFRKGAFPPALRIALLKKLRALDAESGVDTEGAVREQIVRLLETQQVTPNSMADRSWKKELLLNQLFLYRDHPDKAKKIAGELQDTIPAAELVGDVTVVRLLRSVRPPRWAFVLPPRIRKLLFNEGLSPLGVSSFAIVLAAIIGIMGTLGLMRGSDDLVLTGFDVDPVVIISQRGALHTLASELRFSSTTPMPLVRTSLESVAGHVEPTNSFTFDSTHLTSRATIQLDSAGDGYAHTAAGRYHVMTVLHVVSDSSRAPALRLHRPFIVSLNDTSSLGQSVFNVDSTTEGRWFVCDPARARIDSMGVLTPSVAGWVLVGRTTMTAFTDLAPVYVANHALSSAERTLIEPVPEDSVGRAAAIARKRAVMTSDTSLRLFVPLAALPLFKAAVPVVQLALLGADWIQVTPDTITTQGCAGDPRQLAWLARHLPIYASLRENGSITDQYIVQLGPPMRMDIGEQRQVPFILDGPNPARHIRWSVTPGGVVLLGSTGGTAVVTAESPGRAYVKADVGNMVDSVLVEVADSILAPSYAGTARAASGAGGVFVLSLSRRSATSYVGSITLTRRTAGTDRAERAEIDSVNTDRFIASFDSRRDSLRVTLPNGSLLTFHVSPARDRITGTLTIDGLRGSFSAVRGSTPPPMMSACSSYLPPGGVSVGVGEIRTVVGKNPKAPLTLLPLATSKGIFGLVGENQLTGQTTGLGWMEVRCGIHRDSVLVTVTPRASVFPDTLISDSTFRTFTTNLARATNVAYSQLTQATGRTVKTDQTSIIELTQRAFKSSRVSFSDSAYVSTLASLFLCRQTAAFSQQTIAPTPDEGVMLRQLRSGTSRDSLVAYTADLAVSRGSWRACVSAAPAVRTIPRKEASPSMKKP
ncbi:MAG: hypothetical protein JWM95_18 [Gemmatimonadetes bacterium]|nr:hypothetical protein [Gemmatimonadota bacterium]